MIHDPLPSSGTSTEAIAELERRLARIEAHLGLVGGSADADRGALPDQAFPAALRPLDVSDAPAGDELEFKVGQNWFSLAGILALTAGVVFMLSLPYPKLPVALPGVAGLGLAAGLFLLAHISRRSFELMSGYFRGAAMAVLFVAALRFFFPESRQTLALADAAGRAFLLFVVAVNLTIALHRHCTWLAVLALATGFATAVVVGSLPFALALIATLALAAVVVALRRDWPALIIAAIPLSHLAYVLAAVGDPVRGGLAAPAAVPALAPALILLLVLVFAAGTLLRRNNEHEDATTNSAALLNCVLGYGVFLLHTGTAGQSIFAPAHAAASVIFLGLGVVFWARERSEVSTFLYAMTGYAALSAAIIKASAMPMVFVWLSLQSLVVVTTAIWFRSRFIVVANFIIFAMIVVGYVLVPKTETGISIGFGLVALVSARILNWQKDRLALRTELMRNAYLVGAFIIFPYALYHLVAAKYVGLAWVGLALVYYGLNLIVQNQKYRWMGHGTLLMTLGYVVVIGTSRLDPLYRIVSFLVLGTVLLIVSLCFTRWRRRQLDEAETQ
jgi:hypothetical protein